LLRLHGPFANSINRLARRLAARTEGNPEDANQIVEYAAKKVSLLDEAFELIRENVKQRHRGAPRKRPWYRDLIAATALLWRFVHRFERARNFQPIAALLEVPELGLRVEADRIRKIADEIVRRLPEENWAKLYTLTKLVYDEVGSQNIRLDRR